MALDGVRLSEPVAPSDRLVPGLETMSHSDEHRPGAVLPVDAPSADRRLRDEHANLAGAELR